MDSYTLFEEEIMSKMHHSLVDRFNLDQLKAAELTLEIMEILTLNEFDVSDIDPLYMKQLQAV